MTAAVAAPIPRRPTPALKLKEAVSDTGAIVWRNLLTIRRVPQLVVFTTVQPLPFVLMLRGARYRKVG